MARKEFVSIKHGFKRKVLFFEKKEGVGYKPYKRDQRIKVTNRINIDQN
ncbi:hypothetical protein HMPREF1411_00051 [Helicobacter pylori GAM250AFi]|nr:hypothetical protein HMPREF1411_00051 [Helicobacter pylori GAM250AFi]EMH13660.1 hypothetical protein HMPREF1414_01148 [Helicobacter pylori GAM252T]EMH16153.1 hypothetical protein HMPREF1412_00045 [Helicobacter pylori GAM250T]EMH16288.1 hypothetical protein HMPREF1413_00182 [Helicobacter pylori GAM252Bi]EMH49677.1 hypothetical protein HMPREF1438_00212 [Helicobacter pylori HP250AFii]EMH50372.1 hypothetical protein HMPREF1439_00023 [Helicobacter pylori HP250AFiii]EMH54339.1 hypothetical prote